VLVTFVLCFSCLILVLMINRPVGLRGARNAHIKRQANLRALHSALLYTIPASPFFSYKRRHHSTSVAAEATDQTPRLTHIDGSGRPTMVDVSSKNPTQRTATASGRIWIPRVAYELITEPVKPELPQGPLDALEKAKRKARAKGDVLTVAQLAAIMGCKRTSELVPLCHPLQLSHISVKLYPEFCSNAASKPIDVATEANAPTGMTTRPSWSDTARSPYSVLCVATVTCEGKTGVEMEALTAVSVGLLTVWDMLKAVAGQEMIIGDVAVVEKHGGKSGDFIRSPV
jgi:molybdenum cofactor biosynthesis enzyme